MKPSPASYPAASTAAFWVAKNGGGKRSEQWFLKFWSIHRLVFSPRTYTGRFHFSSSRASGSASRLSSLSASRCGRWTSLSCAKKSSTLDRLGIGMAPAYPPAHGAAGVLRPRPTPLGGLPGVVQTVGALDQDLCTRRLPSPFCALDQAAAHRRFQLTRPVDVPIESSLSHRAHSDRPGARSPCSPGPGRPDDAGCRAPMPR